MANDEAPTAGPQAAACLLWLSETARGLATEAAGEPGPVEELVSAWLALGTVSLGVGIALAMGAWFWIGYRRRRDRAQGDSAGD